MFDEFPVEDFEEGDVNAATIAHAVIGRCPSCGSNVVETDKAYTCNFVDCKFVLWKDNRFLQAIGKEMTKELAEEFLNCGTAKLTDCKSRRTGKTFDCYVDITYNDEGMVKYVIRFPESKRGGE
ncbi:MAG: hypothetical protein J6M44_06780 [Butyrivibrio sp.]|nr:hypothetical protein [Butyrivibrio sp.]